MVKIAEDIMISSLRGVSHSSPGFAGTWTPSAGDGVVEPSGFGGFPKLAGWFSWKIHRTKWIMTGVPL